MVDLNKLKEIGCEWQKNDMHRIYFNNIAELLGMEIEWYKTGTIRNAKINGETISNTKANSIRKFAKVWYDVKTGTFECKDIEKKYFDMIVEELERQATPAPEEVKVEIFYGKPVSEYSHENINEIAEVARMRGHKIKSRSDLAKLDPGEQGLIYDVWVN